MYSTEPMLEWETLPHPAYSTDLAPLDYHLFRALKKFLREKTIRDFDDIKSTLEFFFKFQLPRFWSDSIQSLPSRWIQVVDTHSDYIID